MPLYSDEFYYKQKIYLANLERKVFTYYTVREQHLTDYSEYNEFIKEIDKIKMLAPELQFNFWVKLLSTSSAINEREIYEKIVVDCNESLQNKFAIRRVILLNEIENNLKTVDFNEIRKLCDSNDDYSLLHAYINSINALKKGEAERIFNNYRYLLISDYLFLDDYIRIKQAKSKTNFSPVKFLLEYKSSYENSLGYHILLAFYYSNNKKYRNQFDSEAEWIKNNLDDFTAVPFVIVDKLVKVLYNAQQYEILVKLSNSSVPVLIRLQIANCLQEIKEYVITAIEIYESIKQFNSDIIGLNRCLSNCYYKLGDMTKAQNCLCEEIDLKCNSADLYNLFVLRLEIKDIKIDKYVDIAKEFVDSKLYHMIGIAYLQANKYEDAYQYLIKSLLLDDKNLDCLNTFMSLKNAQNGENQNQKNFEIGVTATLKNKAKNLKIALWSDVIIDGFKPIKLAGIINYKESDSAVEDILYCAVGDRIKYKDEEYEVISLDYTDTLIYGFAMRQLITSKRAYAIEGATIEESIQKLKEVLQERNEYIQNIVKAYNDSNGWLPITILSAKLGKNYLETYNFVYCENHKRIRNINAVGISSVPNKFLLSYDAVYLLAVLDIDTELIKQLNCKVSLATKNIMLHEVNELMNDCMNEKGVGQVILKDNNIYRIEKTNKDRVEQKKFLLRLKRIIDCIEVERKQYRYEYNDDFSDLFVTEKLQLEGDIIGCLKNLVSDDAFIYTVSSFHRFNIIGINRFLILLNLGVKEHIEIIKRLSYLNFGNYITSDVYDDLKQKIISEKNTDKQKEFVELFYDLLTAKSMEVLGDKWKHNSILVRELVRTKEIDAHSADAFDKIAIHALVDNYAKEYPDEYKQRVEELEKKLRTKVYYKDGKICIESYFDDGEEDN